MGESAGQTILRSVVQRLLADDPRMPQRLERMGRDVVEMGWGKLTKLVKPPTEKKGPAGKPAWWEQELRPILDPFSRGAKQQLQERSRPVIGAAIAVGVGLLVGSFLLGLAVGRRERKA